MIPDSPFKEQLNKFHKVKFSIKAKAAVRFKSYNRFCLFFDRFVDIHRINQRENNKKNRCDIER